MQTIVQNRLILMENYYHYCHSYFRLHWIRWFSTKIEQWRRHVIYKFFSNWDLTWCFQCLAKVPLLCDGFWAIIKFQNNCSKLCCVGYTFGIWHGRCNIIWNMGFVWARNCRTCSNAVFEVTVSSYFDSHTHLHRRHAQRELFVMWRDIPENFLCGSQWQWFMVCFHQLSSHNYECSFPK